METMQAGDPCQAGQPSEVTPSTSFHTQPILNSPYEIPRQHWELDKEGQPTGRICQSRRHFTFITPIPKPKKREASQREFIFHEKAPALETEDQNYNLERLIGSLRARVNSWRAITDPAQWRVTGETARLLRHWRRQMPSHSGFHPFFCQVEAVETVIWLTEVAPKMGKTGRSFLDHLAAANQQANSGLSRLALKLATGAGKTTVMAMIIAWQTVNAVRHPGSQRFSRGFLVVTPGITIRDRLRVLQPNDPDSYYQSRDLAPPDMVRDLDRAKIVITNYHAFLPRETLTVSKGGRALLQGRGPQVTTHESDGQMLQRVMPELMSMKNILVLNDEAHHCYREKPAEENEEDPLKGEEKKEADKNQEAARVWVSGLETVQENLGVGRVIDLSATPFFLRGSGYAEGTLFPWTVSDFSLMDAIECGIVKLPRVPVADNIPSGEMPRFRNLWDHIGKKMPKKGRGKGAALDPLSIPAELQTALTALYDHYSRTFHQWQAAGISVPPCFIVVCSNTSTSKLIYDYISGFQRQTQGDPATTQPGALPLFRNFDEHGRPLARPRTLLIDSEQLESGQALDPGFRTAAADEVERFRKDIIRRTGNRRQAEALSDADLLREVMNTVGKDGRLGGGTRCVVSVSMLTEGWDANTVTHVLGVRAFGAQLLCEQVVGRALRRQSYDLNDQGLFDVEYADVLGIPFDFTARPVVAPPQPPREVLQVRAVTPERDGCEIRFPRVQGYRVELPREQLSATFNPDSTMEITPDLVGPTVTRNEGIFGEGTDLRPEDPDNMRHATIAYKLTKRLLETRWRDPNGTPKWHLFGQLKRITGQWLKNHLVCKGGAHPAQVLMESLADTACGRITGAIMAAPACEDKPVQALLDPYNPTGSTMHVRFTTAKRTCWRTDPRRCHVNRVVYDSQWEAEFCRVAEAHPRVRAYVKNHGLGFEIPYRFRGERRMYWPDFILLVEDGHGEEDLLHLVVEIKGYRQEDAKEKKNTMTTYWLPAVNQLADYGRWDFAEFRDAYEMEGEFDRLMGG
ncbi:MAG: DEAD/DEAH box helicase family protein [Cyanobacteria bacterium MAG CAR4_bin_6]|nr:DEAD/DEAH box helicase family protein [Cyanobacteria bacterium MAG CAR4_bin_6]